MSHAHFSYKCILHSIDRQSDSRCAPYANSVCSWVLSVAGQKFCLFQFVLSILWGHSGPNLTFISFNLHIQRSLACCFYDLSDFNLHSLTIDVLWSLACDFGFERFTIYCLRSSVERLRWDFSEVRTCCIYDSRLVLLQFSLRQRKVVFLIIYKQFLDDVLRDIRHL